MATKKPAPKKATVKSVAKPVAKKATPSVSKPVAKKAAPAKAAKPVAKKPAPAKPVAKKAAPTKAPKPAAKPAPKPEPKKAVAKAVAKPAPKPEPKKIAVPAAKPVVKEKEAPVAKPAKPAKEVVPKPEKPAKVKPAKAFKPYKAPKPVVKVSGIEKSTTVIPLKQLPMKKKEEPVKDVKVPKTTTKVSVPYNPGYTSLEKRTDTPKTNEPLVRYSDAELNEFKELINKKLEASKKELAYLQGLITRKDETGGDNEDGRYMTMEDGSLSMEREQLSQMASRQITFIDHLEKALRRIENKTYGICRVTGKLIDKARLRAVPHATLSLEAKLGLVKPGSGE
jgi:RNA polymerase-binding transcription factor DksA